MTGRPLTFEAETGRRGALARAAQRVRLRALAVLLLTFVAGLAVGWAVSRRVAPPGQRAVAGAERGERGPRGGRGLIDRRMAERLKLTPVQQAAIDSVLRSHRGEIDAFWRGPGAQLRAILDSARADVRAVLDPAQRLTFDSIQAERRRHEQARGRGEGRAQGRGQEHGRSDSGPGGR